MYIDEDVVIVKRSPGPRERSVVSFHHVSPLVLLKPEREGGGGVKVDFPLFTYLIRAAGDEQEEKKRSEI